MKEKNILFSMCNVFDKNEKKKSICRARSFTRCLFLHWFANTHYDGGTLSVFNV